METNTSEVVQDTVAQEASSPSETGSGDASPAASTTTGGEDAASAWNGELESLKSQPWWASLPENVRSSVEGGLKSKHATWQRGYQTKFEEFKKGQQSWQQEKAALEKSVAEAKDHSAWVERLLGSDDSASELNAKIESLSKALSEKDSTLSALERERDEWKTRLVTYEEQVAAKEAEYFDNKFKTDYPDIYNDYSVDENGTESGAFSHFLKLIESGFDSDAAAKMTRAIMPPPVQAPGPRKVEPPPSIRAQTAPGTRPNPSTTQSSREFTSYDEAIRSLRAQAMGDIDDE